jgi:LysR family nitrogen assimilation transcriptional regulator
MIYGTSDPKGLAVHHGLSEEICLFASPSADRPGPARRLGPLQGHGEAAGGGSGAGHGLRELIEDAALSARAPILPVVEIDSYSQIKKLAMRGVGYGILRAWRSAGRSRRACSGAGASRSRPSRARSTSPTRPSGRS